MFNKYLVGNEKAIVGGLGAGVVSLLGQFGVSSQLTLKEALYSVLTWIVTHVLVYHTTNTPKAPVTSVTALPEISLPSTTPVPTATSFPPEFDPKSDA